MRKLRLLVTPECNRTCPGCCNNDWDLEALPVCTDYTGYDEILLTGGEPMLELKRVLDITRAIKDVSDAKVYLYTAKSKRAISVITALAWLDGITLTLHEQTDVAGFVKLTTMLESYPVFLKDKSLRLNVFDNVDMTGIDTSLWNVKDDIVWVPECPLPVHEEFMRYDY